jgi:hypothetical protein
LVGRNFVADDAPFSATDEHLPPVAMRWNLRPADFYARDLALAPTAAGASRSKTKTCPPHGTTVTIVIGMNAINPTRNHGLGNADNFDCCRH